MYKKNKELAAAPVSECFPLISLPLFNLDLSFLCQSELTVSSKGRRREDKVLRVPADSRSFRCDSLINHVLIWSSTRGELLLSTGNNGSLLLLCGTSVKVVCVHYDYIHIQDKGCSNIFKYCLDIITYGLFNFFGITFLQTCGGATCTVGYKHFSHKYWIKRRDVVKHLPAGYCFTFQEKRSYINEACVPRMLQASIDFELFTSSSSMESCQARQGFTT